VRILKSMPMVVMKDGVKLSSLNRSRQHDLPTPESPIRRSFIWRQSQVRHWKGVEMTMGCRDVVEGGGDLLGNRSSVGLPL
jgi:hypothetical protein